MIKQQIKIEKSPFEKQRKITAPRDTPHLQTQVSQDMFEDFMKFARHYNIEHPPQKQFDYDNKANPLKHILNEFLNSHALERQCFTNLYVIMVFNIGEFETPFNTDVHGAVIGFVDQPFKFTKFKPFHANVPDDQNTSKTIYCLEHFDNDTLDLMNLKSLDREVLFGVSPSIYDDFDKVRERLQELYEDIDFDNAYISMFNLNNYLDILQNGVYVIEHSTYYHEGFVVLLDPDDIYMFDRIVARINWSYNAGVLNFEFHVEKEDFFNTTLVFYAPRQPCLDYWNISSGFLSQQAKLELNLKHENEHIERLEKQLELEQERKDKINDLLSKFDKIEEL